MLHALESLPIVPKGPLDLLFVDDTLAVVVKPAGLLSVPGRGEHAQDCMARRMLAEVPDALVVHRLDMATSGLMVFARGKAAQRRLSAAFAEREVDKSYVAVVHGRPAAVAGEIDLPLLTDWPRRPRQKVDHQLGKSALTRYQVLHHDRATGTSRLALEPVTGRTHQLRVHLAAIGHALLGDALYAPEPVRAMSDRLLLHAQSLHLPHPVDGRPLRFERVAPF